jgi:hypothetical protein
MSDNVVEFHRGHTIVLNDAKLTELAGFDGRYLRRYMSVRVFLLTSI